MKFQTLTFVFILSFAQFTFASRGPAVEDFVGMDVEEAVFEPQGTEALFNFEKEIVRFEENRSKPFNDNHVAQTETSNTLTMFTFAIILGLPGLIWLMMMNHLKSRAKVASASNIEVLETYRKKREASANAQEKIKKVS